MAEAQWALTGLGLALLVLLVLPSDQIKLGAKQLHGLIGSYSGHYWQVTYSAQGTTTWDVLNSGGTLTPHSQAWATNGQGDSLSTSGMDGQCVGTVTPTLTWVPATGQDSTTDPPPSQVIVTEMGYARYEGGGAGGGPGTLSDGWSADTPPNSPGNIYGPNYYYTASGTHYEVKDGTSGTIKLSAFSLNASTPGATSFADGNQGVQVAANINVAGASVTIGLTGVNAANQALTGQQVTANLTGAPAHVSSYTWSFIGGTSPNPIKNWDGTNNIQQLFLLTSIDKTGTDTSGNGISVKPISFYDQAADTLTVKCAINLTFPDGTTGNINPQSQSVRFLKPTAVWHTHSTDPTTGPVFDQTQMGYIEKWDATITVPSPFSGGSGCFAQVITPTIQFQRYSLNNQPSACYLKVPQTDLYGNTSYVLPTTGLDTYFPYPIGSSTYQPYPQGYQWDVSGQGISADTPDVKFGIGASDNGGNNWYTAFDSDTCSTWLMYQPSTGGTGAPIWVPLQRIDWTWTGNVVKDKATGQWNAATNGNQPVTGQTSDPGVPTDQPPQWSSVNVGDTVLRP